MSIQATDFISVNRGGTVGDGASGQYLVAAVQEILDLVIATFPETVTSISFDASSNAINYVDEGGNTTSLDLSSLSTDVFVSGGAINGAGQLVLSDNDSDTPDVVIDLSAYINAITDNAAAGTITLASAGGSQTVSKTGWMAFPAA